MSFILGFFLGLFLGIVATGVWVFCADLLSFYREGNQ